MFENQTASIPVLLTPMKRYVTAWQCVTVLVFLLPELLHTLLDFVPVNIIARRLPFDIKSTSSTSDLVLCSSKEVIAKARPLPRKMLQESDVSNLCQ